MIRSPSKAVVRTDGEIPGKLLAPGAEKVRGRFYAHVKQIVRGQGQGQLDKWIRYERGGTVGFNKSKSHPVIGGAARDTRVTS